MWDPPALRDPQRSSLLPQGALAIPWVLVLTWWEGAGDTPVPCELSLSPFPTTTGGTGVACHSSHGLGHASPSSSSSSSLCCCSSEIHAPVHWVTHLKNLHSPTPTAFLPGRARGRTAFPKRHSAGVLCSAGTAVPPAPPPPPELRPPQIPTSAPGKASRRGCTGPGQPAVMVRAPGRDDDSGSSGTWAASVACGQSPVPSHMRRGWERGEGTATKCFPLTKCYLLK